MSPVLQRDCSADRRGWRWGAMRKTGPAGGWHSLCSRVGKQRDSLIISSMSTREPVYVTTEIFEAVTFGGGDPLYGIIGSACCGASRCNHQGWQGLNQWYRASRECREMAAESQQIGYSLLQLACSLGEEPLPLAEEELSFVLVWAWLSAFAGAHGTGGGDQRYFYRRGCPIFGSA
jgi:hypothetical protein